MIDLEDSFSHDYEITVRNAHVTPNAGIFIPTRPHLVVDIQPQSGGSWTATFGTREADDQFVTGLFSTPWRDTLCVVVRGDGYFVRVTEPGRFYPVDCIPVRHVLSFPRRRLLVFGNFTGFVAFGPAPATPDIQPAWRTAPLGFDDLEVSSVSEDSVEGRAWNAPEERMVPFRVTSRPVDIPAEASRNFDRLKARSTPPVRVEQPFVRPR